MNLAERYAAFLTKEDKERDPHRLYVTDVGKCQRAVAYRLEETPKNQRSESEIINNTIMFDLAEHFEDVLCEALDKDGLLVESQMDIPFGEFRDNWGGRLDILANYGGLRVIEVKSLRSNAFNYAQELPKTEHCYQASIYDYYLRKAGYQLEATPLLWYVDRGGSNTPLEFEVEYEADKILSMMDSLDIIRHDTLAGDLPERLPKVLKFRNRKMSVVREPDWHCGYCDYSDECKPDMSKQDVATFSKKTGKWTAKSISDLDHLIDFADIVLEEVEVF